MHPLAVLRPGDYHADTPDAEHPSATAVRRLILSGSGWRQYVPAACTYENAVPHALLWGEKAMLARLRGMEQADWARAAHGSEGLWSKGRMYACWRSMKWAAPFCGRQKRRAASRL